MSIPSGPSAGTSPPRPRRRRAGWNVRLTPGGVVVILLLNLLILALLSFGLNTIAPWFPGNAQGIQPSQTAPDSNDENQSEVQLRATITPTDSQLTAPVLSPSSVEEISSPTPSPFPSSTPNPGTPISLSQDLILLALNEGSKSHLFAYQPQVMQDNQPIPLTRLTNGPWQDIDPAISPDGSQVAFASNRNGYWDIYLLEIGTGLISRVTDSLEYDASPSWSPDGSWLVYETYQDDNIELMILPLQEETDALRLTNHPAADYHPTWSPQGRQIAFVSNRSGDSEIWIANLDEVEADRFHNVSRSPGRKNDRPAWSPDGSMLAWVGEHEGYSNIYIQSASKEVIDSPATVVASRDYLGSGNWPVWSSDSMTILTTLSAPNGTYLTAYPVHSPGLVLPPLALPGSVSGITWGKTDLSWPPRDPYRQAAQETPAPLWQAKLTSVPESPSERYQLVSLEDVEAPHAMLHDAVDEAFQALRQYIAEEIGWDFLSTLENAFVPLTSPLSPGMGDDWLYTGRAFAFTTLPINAGWITIMREDFGSQTYWRIYLRARPQDGSVGAPLYEQPWDFNARYSGDTDAYEAGGRLAETIPMGYWVDFTRFALSYGWERLPALSIWRSSYPATHFNEFAFTQGLDWRSAMLQIYPPEILITPTAVVPPTRTFTPTPRWYQTPTPSYTPTTRPTFTPISPTPSVTTISPSSTPTGTATTTPVSATPTITSTRTPLSGAATSTP
jgi:TolB protein